MTSELSYPTRTCPDCGTVYEQRYYHALGSCEPCNDAQAAVRSGRATLTSWLLAQLPETPRSEPPTPKQAKLRQHPDGRIEALSSDGHAIYRVTVAGAGSCTCPAGQRGALCYHLRTARERYALPANVVPFPARRATKDLLYA